MTERPRVIAHRGWSGVAPENTPAAFRRALELDIDMIELDVLVSRDGELVVIHDATVDRTTDGTGAVADLSLAELRALDAGSWFAPEYAAERVPLLREVFDLVGTTVAINVEIKEEAVCDEVAGGITERVIDAVHAAGAGDRVVLSSFDMRALRQAREIDPGLARAALWDSTAALPADPLTLVDDVGASVLHADWAGATEEVVEACRARGVPVAVYTVDDIDDMRAAVARGVDGVFTNWPDRLLQVLSS